MYSCVCVCVCVCVCINLYINLCLCVTTGRDEAWICGVLNYTDPLIHRLFMTTHMNDEWWQWMMDWDKEFPQDYNFHSS